MAENKKRENNMIFSLAPMEGITGFVFRNGINEFFKGSVDKFYSPFVTPHLKRPMTKRELEDVDPANNKGFTLIPQIMTNDGEGFDSLLYKLYEMGYKEVNLNLGCPSGTVTARGRGSGFLKYPDKLDSFLENVYKSTQDLNLSLKTRIGFETEETFPQLLDIYNKYPITELIVHPRIGKEGYSGVPHIEAFIYALKNAKVPVIYNGDIYSVEDYKNLIEICVKEAGKEPAGVMMGRGLVRNPALARKIKGGDEISPSERAAYLDFLIRSYRDNIKDDNVVIQKLKEVWVYMQKDFEGKEKLCKKMFKCKDLESFMAFQNEIINN